VTGIAWPTSLPQSFLVRNFRMERLDYTVRTNTDSGIVKTRMFSTSSRFRISGTMIMTASQLDILYDFISDKLRYGSLRFRWTNPVNGNPADFLLTRMPSVRAVDDKFEVNMELLMEEV